MDKNFVDIDNLVRQRLEGGEAQERSGSWQNMRELLDKEMPQHHGTTGQFFGRRMFGALALLVLVGVAGVGSYKYVTVPGNTTTGNNVELAVASRAPGSSSVPANGVAVSGETPASVAGTPGNPANSTAGNKAGVADNTTANPVAAITLVGSSTPAGNAGTQATANVPANNNRPNAANNPGNNNGSAPIVAATVNRNANDKTQNTSATNAATTVPAKATTAAKERNGNKVVVVKANNTAGSNKAVTGTTNARTAGTDKMAVSSNGPAVNNGIPVFVTKTGKRIPGDKLQKLNTDKTRQNNANINPESANALKGKRVIQRMRLIERFIKTTPSGEGFYKMDTISVVTLTEELGIITETKVSVPKPASGDSKK